MLLQFIFKKYDFINHKKNVASSFCQNNVSHLKKNVQRGTVHKQTAIHVYTWPS